MIDAGCWMLHTYTHMHAHILYIIHVMIDAGCWMLDAKGIAPAMVTMRRRDCKSHSISHSIVYSIVYDIVYTIIYAISLCYLQHFCTTRSVLNSIYNTFASQSGFWMLFTTLLGPKVCSYSHACSFLLLFAALCTCHLFIFAAIYSTLCILSFMSYVT